MAVLNSSCSILVTDGLQSYKFHAWVAFAFPFVACRIPGVCFDGFLNVYVLVGHKGEETDYLSSLNESTDYQIPSTVLGMS